MAKVNELLDKIKSLNERLNDLTNKINTVGLKGQSLVSAITLHKLWEKKQKENLDELKNLHEGLITEAKYKIDGKLKCKTYIGSREDIRAYLITMNSLAGGNIEIVSLNTKHTSKMIIDL